MNEAERVTKNVERLVKVDVTIRKEVTAVLATLEHYGFEPKVARGVWRSPEEQEEMFRRGVSQKLWGFHCAVRDGQPASLAADIVDADLDWDAPLRFWLAVGYAAHAQGLGWGGYFGLTKALRAALRLALPSVRTGAAIPRGLKVGWDPAHVQVANMTIAEARVRSR